MPAACIGQEPTENGCTCCFLGSSLIQMGEYFEILAARVDPGRIRKR
jgi:hypothetical protein